MERISFEKLESIICCNISSEPPLFDCPLETSTISTRSFCKMESITDALYQRVKHPWWSFLLKKNPQEVKLHNQWLFLSFCFHKVILQPSILCTPSCPIPHSLFCLLFLFLVMPQSLLVYHDISNYSGACALGSPFPMGMIYPGLSSKMLLMCRSL